MSDEEEGSAWEVEIWKLENLSWKRDDKTAKWIRNWKLERLEGFQEKTM